MLSAPRSSPAPRVLGVTSNPPPHRVPQAQARAFAARHFAPHRDDVERLLPVFDNAGIDERQFCVPVEWFARSRGLGERNDVFLEQAETLAAAAVERLLDAHGLRPTEVDAVVCATTTGLATPSLEARLCGRLGFRPDCRRTPLFGLGCAGGALGLGQAAELLRGRPRDRLLLINVELCGVTFQGDDHSKENFVASALFGDGVTATLLAGAEVDARGPRVAATGSHLWPDTLDVMGWNFVDHGMQVVFATRIPALVRREMRDCVDAFLTAHELEFAQVDELLLHPGGTKVLEAYQQALGVDAGAVARSARTLREHGNCSAATVMMVLEDWLREDPEPGTLALLSALGPGFTAGHVLLQVD